MRGYNIIIITLSFSVKLFLQVNFSKNYENFQEDSDFQKKT